MSEKISEDKIKVIKYMTENSFSKNEIAKEIGASVATVSKYQKKLDVKANGYSAGAFCDKKISQDTERLVIERYKTGMTYKEISGLCGVCVTSIGNILKRNNIHKRGFNRWHCIHNDECIVAAEELRVVLVELNNAIPENTFKRNVNIAINNAIRLLQEEPVE